jgi:hypothetical protein
MIAAVTGISHFIAHMKWVIPVTAAIIGLFYLLKNVLWLLQLYPHLIPREISSYDWNSSSMWSVFLFGAVVVILLKM